MNSDELLARLKQYAYRIVKMTKSLPNTEESKIIKGQILRAAFSSAANYRSACKAYSKKSFSAKLGISFEEMDESVFWLEAIVDLQLLTPEKLSALLQEGNELSKILAKSIITSKSAPQNKRAI
jgi:four helix bundle protein